MKNKITSILNLGLPIFIVLATQLNCAGGRAHLKFDKLQYPASMSAYIYGSDKSILSKDKNLQVLGAFKYEKTFWGMTYSLIRLTDSTEVDEAMNKAIQEKNGDGMINVKVQTTGCTFNSFQLVFSLLPFWPGCTNTTIEGEIIKWNR